MELNAGLGRREPPAHLGGPGIPRRLPGGHLAPQFLGGVDAPVQTLPGPDAQLDFRHVQPAAMLGGVVQLQPAG